MMTLGMAPGVSAASETYEKLADNTFTIVWQSDPQWYSFKYFDILPQINEWVIDNRERLDIKYVVHTGDFVDLPNKQEQWEVMTKAYDIWDKAGLPWGCLPGNHDTTWSKDWSEYSKYFGKSRFEGNPWYGGDYKDNLGHYDLMTLGGVDFIFLYIGGIEFSQEDYDWMNGVLQTYSSRFAVLVTHEYLNVSGGRTSSGAKLYKYVVNPNPNIQLVFCGDNYNSVRRVDKMDDDGDGVADRTVFQMMANYQDLTNGGNGYMRFLEFDTQAGTIAARTYSPYLQDFNAYDNDDGNKDEYGYQDEFTIPVDFSAYKSSGGSDMDTTTDSSEAGAEATEKPSADATPPTGGGKLPLFVGLGLLLVAGGLTGIFLFRRNRRKPS